MSRRAFLRTAMLLPVVGWVRPARAQSITPQTAPRYFTIESAPGADRKGRPTVSGYIYLNSTGQGAARVRLLVETLDGSGQAVASTIAYVDTDVQVGGRTYFEARPKTPGATYRVSIYSGDWLRTGGGF
ncbi:MAG TPA: hypothetical protein VL948_06035 [Verrucomicrobiae bacterium]|jgi:hypothetical protein|nr:hypothetical protein [Verrucomicrobiae bacterium]